VTNCHDLKLEAADGKMYKTDHANSQGWIDKRLCGLAIRQNLTDELKYQKKKNQKILKRVKKLLSVVVALQGRPVKDTEKELGRSVISRQNYLQIEDKRKKKK